MNESLQSWQCASEPEITTQMVSNKPLGQSLGSKEDQKVKTELQTQHKACLITQE